MFKTRKWLCLLLCLVLLLSTGAYGAISPAQVIDLPEHEDGVLLVQFDRELPEQAKADLRAANGLKLDKALDNKGLERLVLSDKRPLHSVMAQLKAMKGVVFVEPDYTLYASPGPAQILPEGYVNPGNDTHYNLLWGLNNVGQAIRGIVGDGSTDVDAPQAWELAGGSGDIIVAVIDEAVDLTHPDLQGVVIDYQKFNSGGTAYNHGTHVAGTIAALDNTIGVVGVAPGVKIMSLSFLGTSGGSTSNAILAINYAKDHGAHIINASWGGGGYSQALKDAIEGFGGPFVAAAGNDGVNTDNAAHYPSAYSSANIVSVAALNNKGQLASFSNYGASSVDVGAPGVDIVSTYPGGYAYMSGTSMAAPHVAGVLALMKSYLPTASTEQLIQALYNSGRPLSSLEGKTTTGKLVDTDQALIALGASGGDQVPPELVSTTPAHNDTNVSVNTALKVTFNEAVKLVGTNITVNGSTVAGSAVGNDIVIQAPITPLSYSTQYTVAIGSDTVADIAGNVFSTPIEYLFTTEAAPVQQQILVVSSVPANGQTNVKRTANIVFTLDHVFTEIDLVKIKLTNPAGTPVAYTASGAGTTKLTINPTPTLDPLAKYTVILEPGALTSAEAALVAHSMSFTTGKK